MLLSASRLHLDYGTSRYPILDCESLDIDAAEKIGLVGRNGAGKSSLLSLLAADELPADAGAIIRSKDLKIHLMEQNPKFQCETIWQEMTAQNNTLLNKRDDYELRSVLTRLGFENFDQPIRELSGGQVRRLSLALALTDRADLLLLDEPTNHLDLEMIEWLEKWMSKSKAAVITVTHDRRFLEESCTRILELDEGHLYSHGGSYETYLANRAERLQLEESAARKRENLYRHELEWVRAGAQARSTKQKSRLDRFEQLREQRVFQQNQSLDLSFESQRLGKKTLEWRNIAFGYTPDHQLFHDFSASVKRGDRIGFVGPNGCGKSTFLNLVSGELSPLEGEFEFGSTVRIGYFRQLSDPADENVRVIDYIRKQAWQIERPEGSVSASQFLEQFFFDKTKQYLPLGRLSGGERRRLELVRVLMTAPNVLLMDEPGNDLDIETLEVLEDYLDSFDGIVLFVSHDRFFIDRVSTDLYELEEDGTWRRFSGGYSDLLAAKEEERQEAKLQKTEALKTGSVIQPSAEKTPARHGKPSLSSKEKRELEEIPAQLEKLEARKEEIDGLLESVIDYKEAARLGEEREQVAEQSAQLEERWMELEEKREQIAEIFARK